MNVKGSKHMTLEQRMEIEACLKVNCTCKHIAKQIEMDERTVSKEIAKRRNKEVNGKYGFNGKCDDEPCKRITKYPFVCNGCTRRSYCFKPFKFYYHAQMAQENYDIVLVDSRIGLDFTKEDKDILDQTIKHGIENGQSIHHIVATNPDKIKCSESTAYRLVNSGQTIIQKIDLRRAVKLKPRTHYVYKEDNRLIRQGRNYIDFLRDYYQNPACILTEMDTVEGPKGQNTCLLTIHITNTRFMLVKVLPNQDKECVTQAFRELRLELGDELYRKIFRFLLTDRGTEFCDPVAIEVDPVTGEQLAHVYFCDSYASYQKGAIEENHTLIRYVLPKQTRFDDLTQEKVDLFMSHINSYHRKSIQNTPYVLTEVLMGEDFLEKTKVRYIAPDFVNLTPRLLK